MPFTARPHKLFSELLQARRSGGLLYFTRTLKIGKGKAKMHAVPFSLAFTCPGVGKSLRLSCHCLRRLAGTFAGLLQQKGMSPAARSWQRNAECRRITPEMPSARSATVEVLARPDGQKAHRNEQFPSDSLLCAAKYSGLIQQSF